MAQWLKRDTLLMSVPAVRFRNLLGAGYQINLMFLPSQSWDIVHLTRVKMSAW